MEKIIISLLFLFSLAASAGTTTVECGGKYFDKDGNIIKLQNATVKGEAMAVVEFKLADGTILDAQIFFNSNGDVLGGYLLWKDDKRKMILGQSNLGPAVTEFGDPVENAIIGRIENTRYTESIIYNLKQTEKYIAALVSCSKKKTLFS